MVELVAHERREAGVERGQERLARIRAVLVDALVAGSARVADISPGQLPHDPVRGLDEVVHRGVHLRGFFEHLQALGELPLRGDEPAVTRQPGLAGLTGQVVDAVRLWLCGVVAPQLDEGVRAGGELGDLAQGCSVDQGRHHGTGGEVGADPDHVRGVDARRAKGLRHRDLQDFDVVGGHLQRPLRRESLPGRQRSVEDRVWIVVDGAAQLLTVAHPDHDGSTRERAEVDADDHGVRAVARWERHSGLSLGLSRGHGGVPSNHQDRV